ncbi:MAG: hypothetical protein RL141_53 [Candidatus Parcubacteria bacterium]|jgi:hypothetical protein
MRQWYINRRTKCQDLYTKSGFQLTNRRSVSWKRKPRTSEQIVWERAEPHEIWIAPNPPDTNWGTTRGTSTCRCIHRNPLGGFRVRESTRTNFLPLFLALKKRSSHNLHSTACLKPVSADGLRYNERAMAAFGQEDRCNKSLFTPHIRHRTNQRTINDDTGGKPVGVRPPHDNDRCMIARRRRVRIG